MSFNMVPENDGSVKSRGGVLGACIPFTKNSKTSKESFGNSRFYIVLSKLIIMNRDCFLVSECVQFLFTICEGSLDEQVSLTIHHSE